MKLLFPLLTFLIFSHLHAIVRTVNLDGTADYSSIQTAIDACANGDVVRAYPGRYYENINFNGHNITLESLYAVDPLQEHIENTIIDGNLDTCVKIISGETGTVNGFTLVNNEQNLDEPGPWCCGGFFIDNASNVEMMNCIVRDCVALVSGGGSVTDSVVNFSNTTIFGNKSNMFGGGGVNIEYNSLVTFSEDDPCSIFNNIAPWGMDINIHHGNQPLSIILSIGSNSLMAPDHFFINYAWDTVPPTVNIAEGYFEQLDQDMYVETWGSDDNPGTSPNTPLKTIARGMQLIRSNPDNPHTLHVGAGTYSFSENGELFPMSLKSHVNVEGAGIDETILDGEFLHSFFAANGNEHFSVSGFTLTQGRAMFAQPVSSSFGDSFQFRDLRFINNLCQTSTGIEASWNTNAIMENIIVENVTAMNNLIAIRTDWSDNMFLNNIVIQNLHITDPDYNYMGILSQDGDVVVRNCVITNNTADDASLIEGQVIHPDYANHTTELSNVLVYNNTINDCGWAFAPIYLQNRYQPSKVYNCTFANNVGNGPLTWVFGYADIYNLLSWNPDFGTDIVLRNHVWNDFNMAWVDAEVSVRNSLIEVQSLTCDLPEFLTAENNLYNVDPLFLGAETGLDPTDMNYYKLSANSPCIDTGLNAEGIPPMDLAGNVRVWNDIVDMGCFEYDAPPYVSAPDPDLPPPPNRIHVSNYPNPVNLSGGKGGYTFIEFTLPTRPQQPPVVEIFNIRGQRIRKMMVEESFSGLVRKAGLSTLDKQRGEVYSTLWDCRDDHRRKIATGVYLYRVSTDGHSAAGKCMVVK